MIRRITDLAAIERHATASDLDPQRLALYLALARAVPGRLTMLQDEAGHFILLREQGSAVCNPSTVIEHYFLARATDSAAAGGAGEELPAHLDHLAANYRDIWISFDNLPPNPHPLDTADYRYNLLSLAGLDYDGYLALLGSDRRRGLQKALAQTARAEERQLDGRRALQPYLEGVVADHCRSRYGGDSLLAHPFTRAEIAIAVELFPSRLTLITEHGRYGFLLTVRIGATIYSLLAGGSDPYMLKRAYHLLIATTLSDPAGAVEIDAGSCFPFLKMQMGFAQRRFFALIQGERDWMKYLF